MIMRSGYDTSWQLPFKIIGRNGVDLNDKWKPYPKTYLSMAVDGFPNMFMSLGPNSGVGSGSLLALIEFEVLYACQAVAKMQRERLRTMEVKVQALRDFNDWAQKYFKKVRSQSFVHVDRLTGHCRPSTMRNVALGIATPQAASLLAHGREAAFI